jgi:hypothetical protein
MLQRAMWGNLLIPYRKVVVCELMTATIVACKLKVVVSFKKSTTSSIVLLTA